MADLAALRDAIGDALATIPSIQVQRRPGGTVHTPAAIVEPGEVNWRGTAMQRGHEKWDMLVRCLVGTAFNEAAQVARDEFFGGAKDIKDAIESHVPLRDGTAAHDVFVVAARKFDAWTYQGTAYLGVEFNVEVYA